MERDFSSSFSGASFEHVEQRLEVLVQGVEALASQLRRELGLELDQDGETIEDHGPAVSLAKANELGPPIGGVGYSLHGSHRFEFSNELTDRLLAHPHALGDHRQPRPLEIDVREHGGMSGPDVLLRVLADPAQRLLVEQPRRLHEHLSETGALSELELLSLFCVDRHENSQLYLTISSSMLD